jgi:hypothetical protein
VTGTYTVFVNNECPECEFGHLDFAMPGDGSWDITWLVACVCVCVCVHVCVCVCL